MMRNAILVLLAVLLAGCGQKGPLYLRDKPPAGVEPQPEEPYRPKPYPKDAARESAPAEQGNDAGVR